MQPGKVSSALLLTYQDFQNARKQGLEHHKQSIGIASEINNPKPARAVVFLYTDEGQDLTEVEQETGARVNQGYGQVRTAIVPVESIGRLSEFDSIQRIKPSRYLKPRLNVAPQAVSLPQFKSRTGLSGKGVVVGIIDSGIDPNHPAFSGRILRIWDQTLNGVGVREGSYGVELSGSSLQVSRDLDGHGTHVAAIAAGSKEPYVGIAPEATLVMVKTDFQDAHIADGIRYIFRLAREMNLPAVVNLSLGGHADAHDGSDSLSKIIDAETGPGRLVCCAAGNEGNSNIHAQVVLSPGQSAYIPFSVPANATSAAWLNGWYPGNAPFEICVRTPGGFITPWQKVISLGYPVKTYNLADAIVDISTPPPDPMNKDHNFFVQIRHPYGYALKGGTWQLRVRNASLATARLDAWTVDETETVAFSGTGTQDSMKIGSPGAASSAITVASYTTRNQWTDIDNVTRQMGLELNNASDFSSEGPLRNGNTKPDVAAPGAMIISALSADSSNPRVYLVDKEYMVMMGTSMASPFIAGILALMLQRNPQLDPAKAKAMLKENSIIPGYPSGTFNPKYGFGLVNAMNL